MMMGECGNSSKCVMVCWGLVECVGKGYVNVCVVLVVEVILVARLVF